MNIDVEYAIKKDIRNNPVVREIDRQQRSDFYRTVAIAAAVVLALLFSTWQHWRVLKSGYEVSKLVSQRDAAAQTNRLLRLAVERLSAPRIVEERAARELHMVAPAPADVIYIDRVRSSKPARAVVADAR